jgi:TRAP transporter TAXI family solute receptor
VRCRWIFLLPLSFLLLTYACSRDANGCTTKFISIGTGGTGGVYYPFGGALARLISEKVPCVQATAEVTGASVDNLKLLQQGKVDVAFTLADALSEGVAGTGPFAASGAIGNVRSVAVLYTNYTHVVARAGAGFRRVVDLRGKVVSVGSPGSGTELLADRVLRAAGLDPRKDITRHTLGVAESAGALKDGKVDAFFWSGGVPTASVEDLAATPGFQIALLPQDDLLPAIQSRPDGKLFRLATLPGGSYRGIAGDTATIGVSNLLVVSASLDDALVETILRTMFDNKAALVAAHPEAAHLERLTSADNLPAPLHPGALRYYREAGSMKSQ